MKIEIEVDEVVLQQGGLADPLTTSETAQLIAALACRCAELQREAESFEKRWREHGNLRAVVEAEICETLRSLPLTSEPVGFGGGAGVDRADRSVFSAIARAIALITSGGYRLPAEKVAAFMQHERDHAETNKLARKIADRLVLPHSANDLQIDINVYRIALEREAESGKL